MTAYNSETTVAYVAEVTPGVTPATPAFKTFRAKGESLKVERDLHFSNEHNGRRGEKNYGIKSAHGSGGFKAEFSSGTLDDFIAGALRNVWTANVVTDANTDVSFTVQTKFEDGATDIYKRLVGARVNSLTLNLRAAEPVDADVAFIAQSGDFADAAIAGATSVAANTEPVEMGAEIDGVIASGLNLGCVSAINLTVNNNARPLLCLGSISPTDIRADKLEVTFSLTALMSAAQYATVRAYADGVSTSLQFDVGITASKGTRFEIPTAVFEDADVVSESESGDVVVEIKGRGLQSSALTGSVIRVTRLV